MHSNGNSENALKPSLSANSSRSASPSHSFIPTPRQLGNHVRSSINEKQLMNIRSGGSGRNSSISANNTPYHTPPPVNKSSLLDRYKIVNKDRNKSGISVSYSTKRQSSSSGVSSARSERSDSSSSLYSEKRSTEKEKNENNFGAEIIVKTLLKKKVVIRPTENKYIKTHETLKNIGCDKSEDRLSIHSNIIPANCNNRLATISTATIASVTEVTNHISNINSSIPVTSSANFILNGTSLINQDTLLWQNKEDTCKQIMNGSSIPKPTAAIKGTAKPTNSVAPMKVSDKAEKQDFYPAIVEEKPPICDKKVENKAKEESPVADILHMKQSSIGEDEDPSLINIKPMEPLLRAYKKGIILPHRITVPSSTFYGSRQQLIHNNYQNQSQYRYPSRYDLKKNDEVENGAIASGYLSDGDLLQSSKLYNDVDGGYMSEGGVNFYDHYGHEMRVKKNELAVNCNTLSKQKFNAQPIAEKSTDVLTALSTNSSLHKFSSRLHGRGLERPDEPPVSPPEPTPTRIGSYCNTLPPTSHINSSSSVVYRVVGSRSHIKKSDSSQQTDNTTYSSSQSLSNCNQWKKYVDGNGSKKSTTRTTEQIRSRNETDANKIRDKRSPSANSTTCMGEKIEKRRTSSTSSSREELTQMEYYNGERKSRNDNKNKVRGVPSSFGYVKRTTNANGKESRTAQVSAVPRTKVKVSDGTQTDIKSYSVGSVTASQLSQGVRERLMMASADVITKSPVRTQTNRPVIDAGSLSDSTYTDLQIIANPYSSWFRYGSSYTASLPTRSSTIVGLTEADSIESLPAQLHQHRASLTHSRLGNTTATSPSTNYRLSRSNSISYLRERTFPRSTKSEKLYPSMLQRSEELEPMYSVPYGSPSRRISQGEPPSPTASNLSQGTSTSTNSRYNFISSPLSYSQGYNTNSPYMNYVTKINSNDEDVHGSAMSLVSTTSSSLYSTSEEKQVQEVRRLRRDLSEAQEKVHTLTSQLSTNAHVVSAFEKSLSSMTQRLQQLTIAAEKKDAELIELRKTVEFLKKMAGSNQNDTLINNISLHNSTAACSPSLARRHTINTTVDSSSSGNNNNIARQLSTDSVSSLASLSSACSLSSSNQHGDNVSDKHKKKHGWLRSSFSKAFTRSKKNRNGCVSDIEDSTTMSAPSSPLLNSPYQNIPSYSSSALYDNENSHLVNGDDDCNPNVIDELRKQLREKDLVLTDIRLEALSSAHQLESLKDTVIKMRNEMINLKEDNERLRKIVTSKSLESSRTSLQAHNSSNKRFSLADTNDIAAEIKHLDNADCKKICISVYFGSHGSYQKYVEDGSNSAISIIPVHSTTNWQALDSLISKAFEEYLKRVDVDTSLGLGPDSIWSYHVGEITRCKDSKEPELLPCGYLVGGSATCITLCLKGALHDGCLDALAFDTLTSKSIIQRYISLITEHRRIMLCGPSGTGKTYLANKLATFLVYKNGRDEISESIATFNVDEKSSRDLRQYLSSIADQCENGSSNELPTVIIIDNLHNDYSLNEIFDGLLNATINKIFPYIIGTMNEPTCSTTDLQLHHNFRWILCANHTEPVKGFLNRHLRRKLIEAECKMKTKNLDLIRVVDWIPKVQQHLNQFLETHSSSEVTLGPRLFMSCPMEIDGSQVWFTDLWNYSIVPYLLDAVREGIQLYGKRAPWQDPCQFIIENYPWNKTASIHGGIEALIRLQPGDVGYETQSKSDPLLNMLMTLQEAANYSSSARSNDSDSVDKILSDCNRESV